MWPVELPSLELVKDFLNSNFTSALMGALVGAFAGAMAAERIADRTKRRDSLLDEIRSTNAAIVVAFTIFNAALSLKRQHIKPMRERFEADKARLQAFVQRLALKQQDPSEPFDLRPDLKSLAFPKVPIDVLRDYLYGKISAPTRPLAAVGTLAGVLASLEETLARRNQLIEDFRELERTSSALIGPLYLGAPYGDGHTDNRYSDSMDHLSMYTDDAIFYSHLLIGDLTVHGEHILAQYSAIPGAKEEKIRKVATIDAEVKAMIPDAGLYQGWLRGLPMAD